MRPGLTLILTALALLVSIAPEISRAAEIGWPEAVGRLAGGNLTWQPGEHSSQLRRWRRLLQSGQLAH
jgi:hypothetical protein